MTNLTSMPTPRLEIKTTVKRDEEQWQVDLFVYTNGDLVYSRTEKNQSLELANFIALSGLSGLTVA